MEVTGQQEKITQSTDYADGGEIFREKRQSQFDKDRFPRLLIDQSSFYWKNKNKNKDKEEVGEKKKKKKRRRRRKREKRTRRRRNQ